MIFAIIALDAAQQSLQHSVYIALVLNIVNNGPTSNDLSHPLCMGHYFCNCYPNSGPFY